MFKSKQFASLAIRLFLLGGMSLLLTKLYASEAPALGAAPLPISKVYLPMVMNCSVTMKTWSGIHLGNRPTSDWETPFLRRIDPNLCGVWPQAIVVFDYQIYNITRWPSTDPVSPCYIRSAQPITDSLGFDYIKRAAQAGTKVIIRIYPSPGNFYDWDDDVNQPNHHLSTGEPVGPNGYCDPGNYRSINDIGNEMKFIHDLNLSHGFSEYGFLPANEPNIEWYRDDPPSSVNLVSVIAWQEMDAYFSAIYDYSHTYHPGVKVLTPPMAQTGRADGININNCDVMGLADGPGVGYDYMPNTYGTKNDGVTWNNYWNYGKEDYVDCDQGGMHVSYHFPQWLKDAIRNGNKQVFITEADWGYPADTGNTITNKEGANASLAADSIRHFFYTERTYGVGTYGVRPIIISWLLTNSTSNYRYNWHKAYFELGLGERPWFPLWYTGKETWP